MADCSAPEIKAGAHVVSLTHPTRSVLITCAAYDDVRNDKLATNWCAHASHSDAASVLTRVHRLLVDYETDKSDKLVLTATGEGVRVCQLASAAQRC